MSLLVESILAVSGLPPKRLITVEAVNSASRVLDSFAASIKEFISGKQGPFQWVVAPTTAQLKAMLVEEVSPDDLVKWTARIGEDPAIVIEFAEKTKAAQSYLLSIIPDTSIDVPGAPEVPLSRDDLDAIWSVYRVISDPKLFISEISAWTLTDAQVKAFMAIFPEIYKAIGKMIAQFALEWVADGNYLRPEVEDVIRTFRLVPLNTPLVIEKPKDGEEKAPEIKTEGADKLKAPSEKGPGERS